MKVINAWLLILMTALLAACASQRFLGRPEGRIAPGEVWLCGRLSVAGLTGEVWDDPFKQPYGRALLLAAWRGPGGAVLLSPVRPDGAFLGSLPAGRQRLTHLLVATRVGDLLTATIDPPLVIDADKGAYDLGGLHWQPHHREGAIWQGRLAAEPHGVQQLTLSGRLVPVADPLPARLLGETLRQPAAAIAEAPFARQARLYHYLEELARRWGI